MIRIVICKRGNMKIVKKLSYPTSHWKIALIALIPAVPIYLLAPAKWLFFFYAACALISLFVSWKMNHNDPSFNDALAAKKEKQGLEKYAIQIMVPAFLIVAHIIIPETRTVRIIFFPLLAAAIFYTKPASAVFLEKIHYIPEMFAGWFISYVGIFWGLFN